jgi:hypothetical protein
VRALRSGLIALSGLIAACLLAGCATGTAESPVGPSGAGVSSGTSVSGSTPPATAGSTPVRATPTGAHPPTTSPATTSRSAGTKRPPVHVTGPVAATGDITHRAAAAVRYANERSMTSGVAVLDTRTNRLYTAGNSAGYYASASVVKTLIAARLLIEGKMHGAVATKARAMITNSDNDAAWDLYPSVGKDALLPWMERHYGIDIGAPPTMQGIWGSTQISARGIVTFYAAVRHDKAVWPWLSGAMHDYAPRSSSGEPNLFGIAVPAPAAAVKNGWDTNRDVKAPSNAIVNSTGFVQGDRYAVAILSEGPGSLYYSGGERIVTDEATILLPHGRVA